jgi:phosphate transport system permease protein
MSIQAINQGNYVRRKFFSAFMDLLCSLAALIGLVFLALILFTLVQRGLAGLSPQIFTLPMRSEGGGLANAIVGSLVQTGIGAVIAAPLGMAVGIYLAEIGHNSRFAQVVRFVNDILLSAPSVLVGLFVYQIIVVPMHGFSGMAGAVALALLATPVIARTTEDMVKLVPDSYREGSAALGARTSTTVLKVIVPAALGGILTGILLAVARISGETAPLLFTSFGNYGYSASLFNGGMSSLPWAIYTYAKQPSNELNDVAWTGALIITVGVLLLNILSRFSLHLISRGRS